MYKKQSKNNWILDQAEENIRCLDELLGITPSEREFLDGLTPLKADAALPGSAEQGHEGGAA